MEIKWKIIMESPGYEISNIGTIRYKGTNTEKECSFDKDGYLVCSLSGKHFKVHRLVAKYFVDNDDIIHKNIVNHKDEDKTNNIYTNLEWCTKKYNDNYGNRNLKIALHFTNGTVCQYDVNGNLVAKYVSVSAIKKTIDKAGGIFTALIKRSWNRYFNGYFWFYDYEKFDNKRYTPLFNYILIKDKEQVYKGNIQEVASYIGVNHRQLSKRIAYCKRNKKVITYNEYKILLSYDIPYNKH